MMTVQFMALMKEGHCDAVLGLCGGQEALEAMRFEEAGVHFASGAVVETRTEPCMVKHIARGGAERYQATCFIRAPA